MGLAAPFRHQKLRRLTQQLLAPRAEQVFCLGVDQHDFPTAADDHHRVRGRLPQRAEASLLMMSLAAVLLRLWSELHGSPAHKVD
jgi:hypothetical protein